VTLATDPDAYGAYRSLFCNERWAATIGDIGEFTAEYEAALERIQIAAVPQHAHAA
jgi:hypothetical protein